MNTKRFSITFPAEGARTAFVVAAYGGELTETEEREEVK